MAKVKLLEEVQKDLVSRLKVNDSVVYVYMMSVCTYVFVCKHAYQCMYACMHVV